MFHKHGTLGAAIDFCMVDPILFTSGLFTGESFMLVPKGK